MEAPGSILGRQRGRSKRRRIGIVLAVVVVLIVVIVPLAVILPGRHAPPGLPAAVLLPLYVYPEVGAWDPLFKALNATSDLRYIIVINPDSGPGNGSLPEAGFIQNIQLLNRYPNVQRVGYVRTGYGNRSYSDVIADVETYAGWSKAGSGIEMQGIFFDEAATDYADGVQESYYRMNDVVKAIAGITGSRTVIHNPGVLPDERLRNNNTDITVTFEESYQRYGQLQSALETSPYNRSATGYIMNSVPSSIYLKRIVREMSYKAEYLFVTSASKDYYDHFGRNFGTFIDDVPTS